MAMPDKISSTSNPKIREVLVLQQKSQERKKLNLMVVEGAREIRLATTSGSKARSVFFCPELFSNKEDNDSLLAAFPENGRFEVTPKVFSSLAYRDKSDGLIALMEPAVITLNDLEQKKDPMFIILESVEKPGNLGAILRTADAARVDAVIVCDPLADFYNPNTIRSSIGCVFTVPVVSSDSTVTIHWLKKHHIRILTAALNAQRFYHECDLTGPAALVMGTEATGLTQQWLDAADENIMIPMRGKIDSLNVSVSTAVLVFEAMRQRGFH